MPVFSLKEAKELQVKNVSENTFKYWGESATYGYYGGGISSIGAYFNTIARLDFFSEIISNPSGGFPIASPYAAAVTNNFYGYFAGGSAPGPSYGTGQVMQISSVQRFELSNETFSNPGRNLPTQLQNAGAVSNPNNSYGYFGGGYSSLYLGATTIYNTISRLDFTNETISLPGKNFSTTRTGTTGVYNQTYGYFGGSGCVISRLDFTSETLSEPSSRYLPTNRSLSGAVSNISYGYFGGGFIPTPPFYSSTISRLEFSTETVSDPGKNFFLGISPGPDFSRYANAGVSANSAGYFGGGFVSPPSAPGKMSTITRIDFGTEILSNISSTFPSDRSSMASFSGGQSIYRGSKTYGYFGGGISVGYSSIISRLDFSNETVSDSPTRNLPTARSDLAATSNNLYGYFGGGFNPSYVSTITRLDFSNETTSNPGKNLPSSRWILTATSSSSYGYFGGGYSPPIYINTISRLDFSNETTSDPGKNLPTARGILAATSSSSYGYFDGGFSSPPFTYYNTISRLDFSNETVSDPGKNLPTARYGLAAVSSSSYGYFGGGFSPPYINTISRLDFLTETVSDPGKNLPTARRELSAVSSSYYGYFGGGYAPPAINTISRLDFSNETVSDPSKNLPSARQRNAAVSNSN
jgi:hypothetical protein